MYMYSLKIHQFYSFLAAVIGRMKLGLVLLCSVQRELSNDMQLLDFEMKVEMVKCDHYKNACL